MVADTTAQCAAHSAPAMGACERCGTFVCGQCGFVERGHMRCFHCGQPAAERPPPAPFAALILSALGLMCPPVSLLGVGLAVVCLLSQQGRVNLGAQYSRWALAVGVMTLVAGGAIYYVAIRMAWDIAEAIPAQP